MQGKCCLLLICCLRVLYTLPAWFAHSLYTDGSTGGWSAVGTLVYILTKAADADDVRQSPTRAVLGKEAALLDPDLPPPD